MNREQLQEQIAQLDKEINETLSSVRLPSLDYRPFPTGAWVMAMLCFAWWAFGDMVPSSGAIHFQSAVWSYWLGIVLVVVALLSTLSWFFRGRGKKTQNQEYSAASHKARVLQDRRRELQAELRALTQE